MLAKKITIRVRENILGDAIKTIQLMIIERSPLIIDILSGIRDKEGNPDVHLRLTYPHATIISHQMVLDYGKGDCLEHELVYDYKSFTIENLDLKKD
jgi:hypothetical protein